MRQHVTLTLGGLVIVVGSTLLSGPAAGATAAPFFGGGSTAFDPEISVVNSGVVLDAQGVVSADRKYVTLNMRPTNTSLLALRDFTFQVPGTGFVGMPAPAVAPAAKGTRPQAKVPTVVAVTASPSILQIPGMTRIDNRK